MTASAPGRPGRAQYQSVQYLRGIAALLVVVHHARSTDYTNPLSWFTAGEYGVDVFFVISGFIMIVAGSHEFTAEFVRRRIIRVVPLYWLGTALWLGWTVFVFHQPATWETLRRLILSLLFVPHENAAEGGHVWPMLIVGWTLNYEMFFYLLFAIGLALRRTAVTLMMIVILAACGLALSPRSVIVSTYTNPLLLEFAAGMMVGMLVNRIPLSRFAWLLPLGFVVLLMCDVISAPRIVAAGLPATAILIGVLAVESSGRLPTWPWLRIVGDASYSIYLFHLFVLSALRSVLRAVGLGQQDGFAILFCGGIILAMIGGVLAYLLLERPLNRFLSAMTRAGHRSSP